MPAHYFTPPPEGLHRPREFTIDDNGRELVFETDAGVFSRGGLDAGTALLIRTLDHFAPLTGRALDLGCGWGALGVIIAARHNQLDVTLCDINPRAVELAGKNIQRNGLAARARAVESDGLANVPGEFDWILMNPPIRAGKPTVRRLIQEAAASLNDTGRLVLVWRKQQGAPSAMEWLKGIFTRVERLERDAGYWVILCAR
ncbi:16S rRNA methyltransferase [Clostridia bacterium]|nr:16S rRNA methyltransferase [Clostridia bacterium]